MRKCKKNYRFFDIFLDILHKLKRNLGQEHVKKGASILLGQKLEQFSLTIPGKMTVFQVLSLLFHLSLPTI